MTENVEGGLTMSMRRNTEAKEMAGVGLLGKDVAYAAVFEGEAEGRDRTGWYLAVAVRGEPGYRQLTPGFGPHLHQKAAEEYADKLNERLGHTSKSALEVVLSTMVGHGAVKRG